MNICIPYIYGCAHAALLSFTISGGASERSLHASVAARDCSERTGPAIRLHAPSRQLGSHYLFHSSYTIETRVDVISK